VPSFADGRWRQTHAAPLVAGLVVVLAGFTATAGAAPPGDRPRLDPVAWGTDHVDQPLPDYMDSGECLFCHRTKVGVTWGRNKHSRTIREAVPAEPSLAALVADPQTKPFAEEAQMILGDTRAQRFLKKSPAYGKAELLSVVAAFGRSRRPKLESTDNPRWDAEIFALQCAGCHTTAVDPQTRAFAAVSIDCYSCHGDASEEHANDPKLMPLAKARKDSAAVVTSICASCHLRSGKSKTSGLPYPTNFVAGDNLFRDFQVDFDRADDEALNPADRHVLQNVRDVVLVGDQSTTCLSCHDVHAGSSKKHRDLPVVQSCSLCHESAQPIRGHKTYDVHSERCQY
jgi:hypothetical protein